MKNRWGMEHVQLGWINWSTEFSWSAIASKQEEKSENAASMDTKQVPKTIAAISEYSWRNHQKAPLGIIAPRTPEAEANLSMYISCKSCVIHWKGEIYWTEKLSLIFFGKCMCVKMIGGVGREESISDFCFMCHKGICIYYL